MTTKTAPLTYDEALAARDALLERIAAGENIDPGEYASIDAAVGLAAATAEAQARKAARDAEAARLAALDELRDRARAMDGTPELRKLYDKAKTALETLVAEADRLENEGSDIVRRLSHLEPLPDDAYTGSFNNGEPVRSGTVRRLDGVVLITREAGMPLGQQAALAAVAEVSMSYPAMSTVGAVALQSTAWLRDQV